MTGDSGGCGAQAVFLRRTCSVFRQIQPDLYAVEQPFQFIGLEMGARLTVVRRANGALWIYAPFAVTREEEAAIRAVGQVADIVVPNTVHTTQVADFARLFPGATVWALPEATVKLRGLTFQKLETMPVAWEADFAAVLFDGAMGVREWVFFHRASKTLLLTDLAFHLPRPKTPVARIVARLDDVGRGFGPSRLERMLVRLGNRKRARAQLDAVLKWPFKRIVSAHGAVVKRGARRKLRLAFRFVSR